MTAFILVPGAGGMAWYWHRAVPLIRAAGHEPIPVDLPGDDRRPGLAAYAEIVIRAIAERSDVRALARHPHSCSCGKRRPLFPDRVSTACCA